jgi:hypothetical protein
MTQRYHSLRKALLAGSMLGRLSAEPACWRRSRSQGTRWVPTRRGDRARVGAFATVPCGAAPDE